MESNVGTGRGFPFLGIAVVPCMALAAVAWPANDRPSSTGRPIGEATTVDSGPESLGGPIPPAAPSKLFPIPPGTVFQRYTVFADDADVAAAVSEQLVYSNTLGTFMAALGGGNLVSDDVTITVPNGCKLTRYEFPVVGKVDPTGIGGDYFVDFALYRICPGSLQVGSRPSQIIPGTQGRKTFTGAAANAPGLISFVAGPNVALQTNMWLGVNFSRGNAGVIVGTPALQGFSCDQFDFPGSPCDSRLGGFPDQPQASFNLEIYADSACSASFTGYKNDKPSGSTFNPGQDVVFADDIQLVNGSCNVIAYEIAVKGVGFYTFDLRPTCEGPAIPGTEQTFQVGFGTDVKIARLIIDPPVPLPQNLWFGAKISVATGQVVIAGQQACIGQTADLIEFVGDHGCEIVPATIIGAGIHGAFSLTITCAGPAPVGACCDMFMTDPNGAAVCREVPETNCPFPPRFSVLQPAWVPGATCGAGPFPYPCGQATCCFVDQWGHECANLTQTQCDQAGDLTRPRQWQRGWYCNEGGQRCPTIDYCLGGTGECTLPRCNFNGRACTGGANDGQACTSNTQCPGGSCTWCSATHCHVSATCCDSCPPVGCGDAECCTNVCNRDAYCCEVEWDDACANLARCACVLRPPPPDSCASDPARRLEGARLLVIGPSGFVTAETDSGCATEDADDPGFGCYKDHPGAQGLQTVWYKFVATQTSAGFSTCNSNPPADDSLVEVFAVGDPSTPQTLCRSLIPIGCGDDSPGCGGSNTNSRVCVQGLVPGNVYYVLVASKFAEAPGTKYRLDISLCDFPPFLNDFCPNAVWITDGTTPFNLANASMDAPVERCIPTMINDIWYNYTATCSGTLTVDTCGASAPASPDTNLAIYDACLCPPVAGAPIACSTDAGGNCGFASRVTLDVVTGNCYKIRLADSDGNRPSGQIKIDCVPDPCADLRPDDSDFDGDVDLVDLAAFQRCYAGPGSYSRDSCCRTFDSTRDGDIDIDDWVDFLVRFKGP